jgi:hypothetical protein
MREGPLPQRGRWTRAAVRLMLRDQKGDLRSGFGGDTAQSSGAVGCRSSRDVTGCDGSGVVLSLEYAETSACAGSATAALDRGSSTANSCCVWLTADTFVGAASSTLSEATGALSPEARLDGWSGDSNVLARPISAGGDAVESSALGRRKEGRGISSANGSNPDSPTGSVLARAISSVSIAGEQARSPSAHQSSRQCRFQAAAGACRPDPIAHPMRMAPRDGTVVQGRSQRGGARSQCEEAQARAPEHRDQRLL